MSGGNKSLLSPFTASRRDVLRLLVGGVLAGSSVSCINRLSVLSPDERLYEFLREIRALPELGNLLEDLPNGEDDLTKLTDFCINAMRDGSVGPREACAEFLASERGESAELWGLLVPEPLQSFVLAINAAV